MRKVLWICTVCATALHCLAADKYYLITSETSNKNGGFYDPSYWSSNGKSSGTKLESFDPNAEYVVSNKKMYIKGDPDGKSCDFGGNSLVLGEGTASGLLFNYIHGSENVLRFGYNGLKIQCGGIVLASGNVRTYVTDGKIHVDTVDDAFAYIDFYYRDITLSHRGALSISEGSILTVGERKNGVNDIYKGTLELTCADSCSGVYGTLDIVSASNKSHNVVFDEYDATFAVASTALPGTLSIGTNCRLKLISGGDVLNVGTLLLQDNTWLDIPFDGENNTLGRVDVTESLTVGRVVNVNISGAVSGVKKIPILTAPASSEMSIRNFKLPATQNNYWLTLETVGDRKILYVTYPDVVQSVHSAEFGSSEVWSDGTTAIVADKDYALIAETNGVPATVMLSLPKDGSDYEFIGNSLNVHYGTTLTWSFDSRQQVFTCPYLRVFNGGTLHGNKKARLTLQGGILDLVSGQVLIGSSNERTLHVDSQITGHAEAWLTGLATGTSGSPHGYYSFNVPNPDFYGTIRIRQRHWKADDGTVYINFNKSCRLTITDALSLGGNLLKHEPKALWLARYASLIVEGNTTLAAESNRGIYIEDIGRIYVGDIGNQTKLYTFRVETPLAINGTFYKEGVGTLELAGTMAFGEDGLAENPTEGSNGFVVTGGVVRVCSAGAIDGCSMLFHEGTSLELAMDMEDEELMAQGLRNVKTDTPFVLGEGVEKLPLSMVFAEGATPPSTKFTVPLLTVNAAAAESVKAMLPAFKTPFKSYQPTLVEKFDETTGDVTFAYELQYQAMKVIIR